MRFKTSHILLSFGLLILAFFLQNQLQKEEEQFHYSQPAVFVTTPDGVKKFERDASVILGEATDEPLVITIDSTQRYQSMQGFGYTLTGGSAQSLLQMSQEERTKILKELFSKETHSIRVSYLRISIGASDLDEKVFSYDDIPTDQRDDQLQYFTLDEDRDDLIPILKEILAINPGLTIMASPWSAPTWMKTNKSSIGGGLLTSCYQVYADYFVRYVEEMNKEGICIDALTIQNEPLHPGNNPSMYMPWEQQLIFVRDFLGPTFLKNNIKTKIVLYDHNADHIEYPINIMNDSLAKAYVDGSAFHLYGGEASAIGKVHEAHPDKAIYFTEQWIGAPGNYEIDISWHIKNLFIKGSRNWCQTILEWNLAADPNEDPHTKGGCNNCLGALTIDGDQVIRNPAYYIVAHASKYVSVNSQRIFSSELVELPNVAFLTPEGHLVLLVANDSGRKITFNIRQENTQVATTLDTGVVATYVWSKP